jgi:hypothetical protein
MLPSSIEFQNVMFFRNEDKRILNLIANHIQNNNKNPLVLKNISFNRFSLTYDVDSLSYLKSLKSKKDLAFCLLNNLDENFYVDKIWYSIFSSLMDMRSGKSIISTDNTELVLQHYTGLAKSDKHPHFKVSVDDAFCGHFRIDQNIYWNDFNYSIRNIRFDIENFFFISQFNYTF